MVTKMIKYTMVIFYPDEKGFFILPEGSIGLKVEGAGNSIHVTALIPIKE